jgi:hypothetical protein
MKRTLACLLLLLLTAGALPAEQPRLKVTVQQLLATPQKFNGTRVDVTGYYRASLEDSSLLASRRVADQEWSTDNAIWLEPDIWDPRYHPHRPPNVSDVDDLKGRSVRVIGTFHYSKITAADERIGQRAVLAYGHMGGWERAISDITYFRPVR